MFLNSRSKKEHAALKQLLAEMQSERRKSRDQLLARHAEVDNKNANLDLARSRLENLLKIALSVDTFDLGSLIIPSPVLSFQEEKQNREIKQLQQDFLAGEAQAVIRYFNLVLTNSEYPAGFPKKAQLDFSPESGLLKISYDLPSIHIIPQTKAYKYTESRDEIIEIALPQKQRRRCYLSVLAQTSLRTTYEIFAADRTERIEHIVFEGYVDAINPSTGRPGRFCLIAFSVQREHFLNLNLQQVEPVACLRGLNAAFSTKPDQLLPVSPSLAEERDDAQESTDPHADLLRALNIRIGELESELQKQKKRNAKLQCDQRKEMEQKTGLNTELQRKNKRISELEMDLSGKHDRIAELVRDLREEQKRNATISSEIQTQNDELDDKIIIPIEEPGGAVPTDEAIQPATQTDTKPFHPINVEPRADEPDNIPIPPRKSKPGATLLEVMSVFIEARGEYADYIGANLPKSQINRLVREGKLERHKFHTYKLRLTPVGKQWYDKQLSLQDSPEPESVNHTAEVEPKAQKTVTFGELLSGGAHTPATVDKPTRTNSNGPDYTQRPAGTPDDLLTDLPELVTIMGAYGSETSRLIEKMAQSDWRCSHDMLEAIFRQAEHVTFANNIIDIINDRANEQIENPLISEEGEWWIIEEEFRDEIEHILKHPGYLNHSQNN